MPSTKVSIIIVSYNVKSFLDLCLDSVLRATTDIDAEVIVIDNLSTDGSCQMVEERYTGRVTLVANSLNVGFSKANNQGLAMSQGEYVHFLNPDTVVPEDFYVLSLGFLDSHKEAGALGPKLIDGRGLYAPDSKKSFPSFSTSVFKVMGLSKLFPNSAFFNRYYAAQVPEDRTATVDILSGCCLLVRREALDRAGGGFDEAYFMYCEDVDLCHRIGAAGYKNYYYPETSIIHYKGESTRKLSYRYMKIFYDAHALFVKKYYPPRLGFVYISALRMVLALRNFFNWGRHLFSLFKMYLLDALLLGSVTYLVKEFWFGNIGKIATSRPEVVWTTLPFFVTVWIVSLFLNGAYDKPFSLFKAGRGMMVGTLVVLAFYALFPLNYRYSRGVVLFSGMTGTVALLAVRWLLSQLKWIKLVPRGKIDYKAAIVGDEEQFSETLEVLKHQNYVPNIAGRVGLSEEKQLDAHTLGTQEQLPAIGQLYRINEIIFNTQDISYKEIIGLMQACAPKTYYKIHVSHSASLVGSYSSRHHAEAYLLDHKFALASAHARRNKRMADLALSIAMALAYPLLASKVTSKKYLWENIWSVMKGKSTWVGYGLGSAQRKKLPHMKKAVLPPYLILSDFRPDTAHVDEIAERYAIEYSALDDMRLTWINIRHIGEKKMGQN